MASGIGRRIAGILAGVFTALVVVGLIEAIGHSLYPLPAGLDIGNPADLRRLIQSMPGPALSFVLAAWFLGAFVGGWVAQRVALWRLAAWIVSAVVIAGAVMSFIAIPHPTWMMVAGIALPLLAALLVSRRAPQPG